MDWQGLPILQEILNELPKGVLVAISLLLIFLGYRKGGGGTGQKDVEIAGAIVDNSAIFKLASAIEQQNELMEENQKYLKRIVEAFNQNSEEIRELAREIRNSVTELLRSRK